MYCNPRTRVGRDTSFLMLLIMLHYISFLCSADCIALVYLSRQPDLSLLDHAVMGCSRGLIG